MGVSHAQSTNRHLKIMRLSFGILPALIGFGILVAAGVTASHDGPGDTPDPLPALATEIVFSKDLGGDGPEHQLAVADDGRIYMANQSTSEVHRYSPVGHLLQRVAVQGQGIGDVSQPVQQVAVAGQRVYTSAGFTDPSILVHDEELQVQERIDVNGVFFGMAAFGDQVLAAVLDPESWRITLKQYGDGAFAAYQPLSRRTTVHEDPAAQLGLLAGDENLQVYAYFFNNTIDLFDSSGEAVYRVVTRLPGDVPEVLPDEIPFSDIPPIFYADESPEPLIRGVAVAHGHAFVLGGSVDSTRAHTVYVFRPDGEAVATIPLEEAGGGANAFDVRDGHLYYRTTHGHLRKLRVDLEPLGIANPEPRWTACGVAFVDCIQSAVDNHEGEALWRASNACQQTYCDCGGEGPQCAEITDR